MRKTPFLEAGGGLSQLLGHDPPQDGAGRLNDDLVEPSRNSSGKCFARSAKESDGSSPWRTPVHPVDVAVRENVREDDDAAADVEAL